MKALRTPGIMLIVLPLVLLASGCTIAGDYQIENGAKAQRSYRTIAGEIELNDCRVAGPVHLTKGSLHTRGATALPGGIVVRHTRARGAETVPHIDIGPGADVASIAVEPNAEVELRISRAARVGQITDATPAYYE